MCGRYTLRTKAGLLTELFDLDEVPPLHPRFNIAPTQDVPIVRLDDGERSLSLVRWGLIPSWAKDEGIGNKLINARAETVGEKPSFRSALKSRRCLVVADGFYEWQAGPGGKTPYYFQLKDEGPFAFAGLWERWEKEGQVIESCTLITTEANGIVAPVHGRMPVILKPVDHARWLDPHQKVEALTPMFAPLPDDWMMAHPVSRLVNSPGNDSAACITPAA